MFVCSVAGTRLPDGGKHQVLFGRIYAKAYKYNWPLQLNGTKTTG